MGAARSDCPNVIFITGDKYDLWHCFIHPKLLFGGNHGWHFTSRFFARIETHRRHRAVCYLLRLCTFHFYQSLFNHVMKIPFWGWDLFVLCSLVISDVLLWAPHCRVAVCASVFVCADECVLYGALLLIIIVQASPRASCQPLSVRHHRLCVCALSPCSVPFSGSRGISPAPATLSILAQVDLEPSVCRARRSLHNPVIPVLAARWQQALQNRRAGGDMG